MRIGVVTVSRSIHTRIFVEHLVRRGHEVTVVTNRDGFEVEGVRTRNVRPLGGRRFKLPDSVILSLRDANLRRVLARERFDVVNVQMLTSDGIVAALNSPSPVVLTLYGSDVFLRQRLPARYLSRLPQALRRASVVHACSRLMAEELERLGAPADRIVTFQYGVDPTAFVPLLRAGRPPLIVSSRQLKPLYRVHLVIEAMPRVLDEVPEARLVVYDEGPEEPRLRALAARLGVETAVEFVGRQSHEVLARDLGRGAVWVSMAESDGTPITLLEAMAAGALPVVADIPALGEWLDTDRAVLVTSPDAESVGDALVEGLCRARSGDHIEPNRRLVTERADRATNLARFEAVLEAAARGEESMP